MLAPGVDPGLVAGVVPGVVRGPVAGEVTGEVLPGMHPQLSMWDQEPGTGLDTVDGAMEEDTLESR